MSSPVVAPLLIGFSAGLRALTPLALLSWSDLRRPAWLHRGLSKGFSTSAAAVELTLDKLPFVPARTRWDLLTARIAIGSAAGYLLSRKPGGALVGAVGALAGTLGGFHARRVLTRNWRRADWAVALVEDVTSMGLAGAATQLASSA